MRRGAAGPRRYRTSPSTAYAYCLALAAPPRPARAFLGAWERTAGTVGHFFDIQHPAFHGGHCRAGGGTGFMSPIGRGRCQVAPFLPVSPFGLLISIASSGF